jgi:hypothetical protein
MKPWQARQGDILFEEVSELPPKAQRVNTHIIALGEATGHQHALESDAGVLYAEANESEPAFMEVNEETRVVHQEHGPITFKRGIYRIVRQREYHPEANRKVLD